MYGRKSNVLDLDGLLARRAAPLVERVLIVDPDPHASRALAEIVRLVAPAQVWTTAEADAALALAERIDPKVVFVEQAAGLDGLQFVRRLRRSDAACRRAVVVTLTATPTVAAIIAARESGAHEVVRKPFARRDLIRRLAAAAAGDRAWIETAAYVGPDRRKFNAGDYAGALRRAADGPGAPERTAGVA